MQDLEAVINRIRRGRAVGCSSDDLYTAIVIHGGLDETRFFLCFKAAILLGDMP